MQPVRRFHIVEAKSPINKLVTKFGGQPVWLTDPNWPLSPESEEPMKFLCQVQLEEEIFHNTTPIMVYVFVDDIDTVYPEAIVTILQPGNLTEKYEYGTYKYINKQTGPSIYEIDIDHRTLIPKEYSLVSFIDKEPIVPVEDQIGSNVWEIDFGYRFDNNRLAGNKIGGQSLLVSHFDTTNNIPEHFRNEKWMLLLQLAPKEGFWENLQPNFYPFHMELGEGGILSIFISKDFSETHVEIQLP